MARTKGSKNKRRKFKPHKRIMPMFYEKVTLEFIAHQDAKHDGAITFYTHIMLDFIEKMYDLFQAPVHQRRFANRRVNFRYYGVNMTTYLNLLHEQKKIVQVLVPSGSLLYFPAKVLDTMSYEEVLGKALEADDEMRAKQRERVRANAFDRAEQQRIQLLRKAAKDGSPNSIPRASDGFDEPAPASDESGS